MKHLTTTSNGPICLWLVEPEIYQSISLRNAVMNLKNMNPSHYAMR